MTGKEKLDKQMSEMKAEKAEKEQKELVTKEKLKTELAKINVDSDLARMMAEDSMVGAENIRGASMPFMKVSAAGKSSHVLADGSRPTDGYFFYAPTKEEFKDLTVNILTVSKGFWLEQLEKEGQEKKPPKFTQVIGGMFQHPTDGLKPFVLFIQGRKWPALNKFTKEASQYTHMKPIPVPMFSLLVKLTTHQEDNKEYGGWLHIVDFEIEKENGFPVIVTKMDVYGKLRAAVEKASELINEYISVNEVARPDMPQGQVRRVSTDAEDRAFDKAADAQVAAEEAAKDTGDAREEVAPDDIPF